jgi:hypothetical protein
VAPPNWKIAKFVQITSNNSLTFASFITLYDSLQQLYVVFMEGSFFWGLIFLGSYKIHVDRSSPFFVTLLGSYSDSTHLIFFGCDDPTGWTQKRWPSWVKFPEFWGLHFLFLFVSAILHYIFIIYI